MRNEKERPYKILGEISWGASEKEVKNKLFSITVFFIMNTTSWFGHFRFIDFHETWQEYVTRSLHESLCGEILEIFPFYSPKTDFGTPFQ